MFGGNLVSLLYGDVSVIIHRFSYISALSAADVIHSLQIPGTVEA